MKNIVSVKISLDRFQTPSIGDVYKRDPFARSSNSLLFHFLPLINHDRERCARSRTTACVSYRLR